MRRGAIPLALGLLGACGGGLLWPRAAAPASAPAARVPVVVELFSSEGCSSCPPADAYLASLDRAQPVEGVAVIALEEHVDYWDGLGWRDPFGSATFSARQAAYARVLTGGRVFTPEIVVDGRRVVPGGDDDAARAILRASAREPKARVTLAREGPRVTVDVADVPLGDGAAEVLLAVTEVGLTSEVRAGENAGRTLAHAPVVRRLKSLGRTSGATFHASATLDADAAWKAPALRVVAFVQLTTSRTIIGAAAL